jgi:hypothetical protein
MCWSSDLFKEPKISGSRTREYVSTLMTISAGRSFVLGDLIIRLVMSEALKGVGREAKGIGIFGRNERLR